MPCSEDVDKIVAINRGGARSGGLVCAWRTGQAGKSDRGSKKVEAGRGFFISWPGHVGEQAGSTLGKAGVEPGWAS